jgi:hypothetical protein
LDSRASSAEIERVKAALVSSIELLSIEALAAVLLTPVGFGQLLVRLGPLLLRLRRLALACDAALSGYSLTESSLVGSLSDFRLPVPAISNQIAKLTGTPTTAWASTKGLSFTAPAPTGIAQIAARLRLISNSGQPVVRIEQYRFADHSRFVVYIPGTQNLSLKATVNPFDMRSNLLLLAGGRSNAARATELALGRAGVGPNDQVMLVGHSQGGLIALDIAKRSVAGAVDYRVDQVVTFGTPAGANQAEKLPRVLSIENSADVVPKLELRENPSEKNWTTLEGLVPKEPVAAHRMESYEQIVHQLESQREKHELQAIADFASGEARVSYYELGQR